jgi:hypothetical protein
LSIAFVEKYDTKRVKTIRFANVHFFVLTTNARHPVKKAVLRAPKKTGLLSG